MRDGRADRPRRVGSEASRRNVGQGSVDEIGEGGFDDRVAAVGDIGVGGRLGGVGCQAVQFTVPQELWGEIIAKLEELEDLEQHSEALDAETEAFDDDDEPYDPMEFIDADDEF